MMTNVIRSSELGREPTKMGSQTGTLDIYDGLSTPISEDVIELSPDHVAQIEQYVLGASEAYGSRDGLKEPTHSQTALELPSLLVRVDATIRDGDIVAYEMEDSPSGQGVTDYVMRSIGAKGIADMIREHYVRQVGGLPMVIVSGARNHGTDDGVIYGKDRYVFDTDQSAASKVPEGQLVIVKTIPGDEASSLPYLGLQDRAVAPLLTEGDKSYLERIGSLQEVTSEDELLVDDDGTLRSQVLKARKGSMAYGVSVYLNASDRQRFTRAGTLTATKLRTRVDEYRQQRGGALVQPFVPPLELVADKGKQFAILRVYVLMGRQGLDRTAQAIGGCYVARPNTVIHGASDAISGAIVVPKQGEN